MRNEEMSDAVADGIKNAVRDVLGKMFPPFLAWAFWIFLLGLGIWKALPFIIAFVVWIVSGNFLHSKAGIVVAGVVAAFGYAIFQLVIENLSARSRRKYFPPQTLTEGTDPVGSKSLPLSPLSASQLESLRLALLSSSLASRPVRGGSPQSDQ